MTDKPTPTDAELKALWRLHAADIGGIFYYARAVLAKWGQPAVAGEPVAWMSPGKERLEFSRQDTVYGSHTIPLYTTPQPTQPQAGAVPLTDDPDCGGESCDCRSYCKRKGGQHGAESST